MSDLLRELMQGVSRWHPRVMVDITLEREQQNQKWGEQNHSDGTGRPGAQHLADYYRAVCQANTPDTDNWQDILAEEVFEAFAEADPAELRKELIQISAVAVAWAEAIDRRTRSGAPTP